MPNPKGRAYFPVQKAAADAWAVYTVAHMTSLSSVCRQSNNILVTKKKNPEKRQTLNSTFKIKRKMNESSEKKNQVGNAIA